MSFLSLKSAISYTAGAVGGVLGGTYNAIKGGIEGGQAGYERGGDIGKKVGSTLFNTVMAASPVVLAYLISLGSDYSSYLLAAGTVGGALSYLLSDDTFAGNLSKATGNGIGAVVGAIHGTVTEVYQKTPGQVRASHAFAERAYDGAGAVASSRMVRCLAIPVLAAVALNR